jgi:EAL domain-containing protein (putative c-di-GMP-specific phosphodiesterase class I)
MGPAGENTEIVRTIVDLGHGLGLSVIAEGIETAQQLAQPRAFGCAYGQGFYFSRPLDAGRVEAFLASPLP